MSQSTSSDQSIELTAELVTQYLKQHPDFFINNDEALLAIKLKHESGKAISLVEYQLNRLRVRNQDLQQQLNYLLDVARENDRLFEKSRRFILELLEANTLEDLAAALGDTLRHDFKVDKVAFILFRDQAVAAGRACKLEEAQSKLGNLLATDKITTGQFRENVLEFLFAANHRVASMALVPLYNHNEVIGLLALGSNDAYRYQSETGTLFLQQIRDILCRILPRFL